MKVFAVQSINIILHSIALIKNVTTSSNSDSTGIFNTPADQQGLSTAILFFLLQHDHIPPDWMHLYPDKKDSPSQEASSSKVESTPKPDHTGDTANGTNNNDQIGEQLTGEGSSQVKAEAETVAVWDSTNNPDLSSSEAVPCHQDNQQPGEVLPSASVSSTEHPSCSKSNDVCPAVPDSTTDDGEQASAIVRSIQPNSSLQNALSLPHDNTELDIAHAVQSSDAAPTFTRPGGSVLQLLADGEQPLDLSHYAAAETSCVPLGEIQPDPLDITGAEADAATRSIHWSADIPNIGSFDNREEGHARIDPITMHEMLAQADASEQVAGVGVSSAEPMSMETDGEAVESVQSDRDGCTAVDSSLHTDERDVNPADGGDDARNDDETEAVCTGDDGAVKENADTNTEIEPSADAGESSHGSLSMQIASTESKPLLN